MFSPDYFVRVPRERLGEIVFQHLYSEQDHGVLPAGMPGLQAGITEWAGSIQNVCISLGWDWARSQDGAISLLKEVPPRTNLMLVDAKGYDVSGEETVEELWALIEALPWQASVAAALLGPGQPLTH